MEVVLDRDAFLKGLQMVQNIVEPRQTLPILANVLLESDVETVRITATDLEVGARVNLERALRADARLDGHLVQGHVDGTGRVRGMARHGDDVRLRVDCDASLRECLVETHPAARAAGSP